MADVKVLCCHGISKDKRFKFYPYWRLKITGDDGTQTTATLTYLQLSDMLKKILLHEFRVDAIRRRKSEYAKYKQFLRKEIKAYEEQLKLGHFEVPSIYREFKGMGYEEEIT